MAGAHLESESSDRRDEEIRRLNEENARLTGTVIAAEWSPLGTPFMETDPASFAIRLQKATHRRHSPHPMLNKVRLARKVLSSAHFCS
jgi:hypothetical protein